MTNGPTSGAAAAHPGSTGSLPVTDEPVRAPATTTRREGEDTVATSHYPADGSWSRPYQMRGCAAQ